MAKEGPVPSPKTRRKAEGSLIPVPSPRTAKPRTRLRSGDATSDPVGTGLGHTETLQNGQQSPQALENGEQQQQNGQQQNDQEPQTVGNGTAN